MVTLVTPADPPEDARPLNVRVAEALGWTALQINGTVHYRGGVVIDDHRRWHGRDAIRQDDLWNVAPVPDYDTSWQATGPLIKQYRIEVGPVRWTILGAHIPEPHPDTWYARKGGFHESDPEPLVAVCNLLLSLHAAGKLKAA